MIAGTAGPQTATLTLAVDGAHRTHQATGNGPVDAIFNAIRALEPHEAELELFQIHAVTEGTDAQAEVTVRLGVDGRAFTARGADPDTLVACARAYLGRLNKLQAWARRGSAQSAMALGLTGVARRGAGLRGPAPPRVRKGFTADAALVTRRTSAGDARIGCDGRLAQLVEQLTLNQRVVGSRPTAPTITPPLRAASTQILCPPLADGGGDLTGHALRGDRQHPRRRANSPTRRPKEVITATGASTKAVSEGVGSAGRLRGPPADPSHRRRSHRGSRRRLPLCRCNRIPGPGLRGAGWRSMGRCLATATALRHTRLPDGPFGEGDAGCGASLPLSRSAGFG